MKTICLLLTPRKGWSNQDEKSNAPLSDNDLKDFIEAIGSIKDFINDTKTFSNDDFRNKIIENGKPIKTEEVLSLLYGVLDIKEYISVDVLDYCISTIKDYIALNDIMDSILNDAVNVTIDKLANYKDDRVKHDNLYNSIKADLANVPTEILEAILKDRKS